MWKILFPIGIVGFPAATYVAISVREFANPNYPDGMYWLSLPILFLPSLLLCEASRPAFEAISLRLLALEILVVLVCSLAFFFVIS